MAAMGEDVGPHNGRLEVSPTFFNAVAPCGSSVSCFGFVERSLSLPKPFSQPFGTADCDMNYIFLVGKLVFFTKPVIVSNIGNADVSSVADGGLAVLRRGKPGNPEADGTLQVQLYRVGSVRPICVHCCVATGDR